MVSLDLNGMYFQCDVDGCKVDVAINVTKSGCDGSNWQNLLAFIGNIVKTKWSLIPDPVLVHGA